MILIRFYVLPKALAGMDITSMVVATPAQLCITTGMILITGIKERKAGLRPAGMTRRLRPEQNSKTIILFRRMGF